MEKYLGIISGNLYRYTGGKLFIEDISAEKICKKFGTPLYVYSVGHIKNQISRIRNSFRRVNPLICYSMKANSNLRVLKLIRKQDCGVDIVSGGELAKALKAGFPAKKIVFAGVGKTEREIISAIENGIFLFTVESVEELRAIDSIARKLRRVADISLRINVDVNVDTHHYTKTARKETKFGMPIKEVGSVLKNRQDFRHIRIKGIQFHLGSNIKNSAPYIEALSKVRDFLRRTDFRPSIIDIGGGFGIPYRDEKVESIESFGEKISGFFMKYFSEASIIFEPGRFIVGNAGILLTEIVYRKHTDTKNFLIVDAGMNDLIRPSLYGSYHEIIPVTKKSGRKIVYDIVGPVCETGDFLGKERLLSQDLSSGDLLAVMGAGAYGFSMSSNYNGRPKPAEVLVSGDRVICCRRREKIEDLWKYET